MNAFLQTLVVSLLLGWSLLVVLQRFFPAPAAVTRQRLAALAAARGGKRLAAWLGRQPAASGCDSGCSSCRSGCTSAAPAASPAPVQWRSSSSGGCH